MPFCLHARPPAGDTSSPRMSHRSWPPCLSCAILPQKLGHTLIFQEFHLKKILKCGPWARNRKGLCSTGTEKESFESHNFVWVYSTCHISDWDFSKISINGGSREGMINFEFFKFRRTLKWSSSDWMTYAVSSPILLTCKRMHWMYRFRYCPHFSMYQNIRFLEHNLIFNQLIEHIVHGLNSLILCD